jgi:putative copper resistance protein D
VISRPDPFEVLTAWHADPFVAVPLVAAAGWYLRAVALVGRRFPRAPWPARRTSSLLGGLAVATVALLSPIDRYAEVFLWVHMVQHLLLILVIPPLLLLAAPLTLARRAKGHAGWPTALTRAGRTRMARTLTHPVLGWVAFAVILAGSHFSPLYQEALEHRSVHALEHLMYLGGGVLFWAPVLGGDWPGRRLSRPLRLLYLVAAGPVNTVTALAIVSSGSVLYPHYARLQRAWGPSPVEDQRMAGALMWVVGDLALVIAGVLVLAAWMRRDRASTERAEARIDAARLRHGAGADAP